MPFHEMDLLWYAFRNDYDPVEVGRVMDLSAGDVIKVFAGFERKIKTTGYLRMPPISNLS